MPGETVIRQMSIMRCGMVSNASRDQLFKTCMMLLPWHPDPSHETTKSATPYSSEVRKVRIECLVAGAWRCPQLAGLTRGSEVFRMTLDCRCGAGQLQSRARIYLVILTYCVLGSASGFSRQDQQMERVGGASLDDATLAADIYICLGPAAQELIQGLSVEIEYLLGADVGEEIVELLGGIHERAALGAQTPSAW